MRGYDFVGTKMRLIKVPCRVIRGSPSFANMGESPLSDVASIKRLKCPGGHSFRPDKSPVGH